MSNPDAAPPSQTPGQAASRPKQIKVLYATNVSQHPLGFYWPSSDQKRSEVLAVKRNSPSDFESVYQCRPGQREGSIFLADDLNAFYEAPLGLSLGINSPDVAEFVKRCKGIIIQGWDTAFSTTNQSPGSSSWARPTTRTTGRTALAHRR